MAIEHEVDDLFDSVFGHVGLVFKGNAAIDWTHGRIDKLFLSPMKRLPGFDRALESTHFRIISSPLLNAYAARYGNADLIAINRGTIESCVTLFLILLSHPDILPHVGNNAEEYRWYDDLSRCNWLGDVGMAKRAISTTSEPCALGRPRNDDRYGHALELAFFAMDFIFLHELGHVLGGHVDYDLQGGGKGLLAECGHEPGEDSKKDQLMELDADTIAMKFMSDFSLMQGHEEMFGNWLLAASIVFMLFDRDNALAVYAHAKHPHPAMRLVHAMQSVYHFASLSSPDTVNMADRAWKYALTNAEEIFRLLGMRSSIRAVLKSEQHEVQCRLRALLGYWSEEFERELDQFRRLR